MGRISKTLGVAGKCITCLAILVSASAWGQAPTAIIPVASLDANIDTQPADLEPSIPATADFDFESDRFADRVYARVDYLTWWIQGNQMPALVTTSPDGTAREAAGVLPDATILFGGGRIDDQERSGVRATIGGWLDGAQNVGIEASWLSLGHPANAGRFFASSAGEPILARPFYNTASGAEDAQLVAYPELLAGTVSVLTASELDSGNLLVRSLLQSGPFGRLDLIAGYRFARFHEVLSVQENLLSTDPGGVIEMGTQIRVHDRFAATNEFHGADLGADLTLTEGIWTFEALAKIAVGNMRQHLVTNGQTVITAPASPSATSSGGLLVLPGNTVDDSRDKFAVIPELDLTLGCQLTSSVRLNLGYSVLVMSSVMRTGDQIDRQIDATQLPTAGNAPPVPPGAHPQATFVDTSLWAQGVSVGVEYRR